VATIWVEVTADLGSNQDIRCYYGNPTADNASNGVNTFLQFYNFEDGNIPTNWGNYKGSAPVNSTSDPYEGGKHIRKSDARAIVQGLGDTYASGAVEAYIKLSGAETNNAYLGSGTG